MASAPEIGVVGLRAFMRDMQKLGVDVTELKAANKRAANVVVVEAQSRAPKVSGALAGSIRASNQKNGAVIRAGSAKVPYASVIHWGWARHNIEENKYLYGASDAKRDEVIEIYAQELERLVESLINETN